jgi:hypothetical protein
VGGEEGAVCAFTGPGTDDGVAAAGTVAGVTDAAPAAMRSAGVEGVALATADRYQRQQRRFVEIVAMFQVLVCHVSMSFMESNPWANMNDSSQENSWRWIAVF